MSAGVKHCTLFFCRDAAGGDDGRLNVSGIGNELYASAFPAKQDRLILAGIVEWEREVQGERQFTLHLTDPDGKPIFTIEGRTEVDRRDPDRAPARSHLIFPLENLVFMRKGDYQVVLEIADERLAGPTLYLLDAAAAG